MKHRPQACRPRTAQRGAATLIVVMVLFFIISMVAAYTSRNLIFEQRTSANQYRATQAFEAADAGIEWALAQLNAGRTTDSCAPSTDDASPTDLSFRNRYLNVNASTGAVTLRAASGAGSVQPSCVFDSSAADPTTWQWSCRCPIAAASTAPLSVPSGSGPAPAFMVRFAKDSFTSGRPDLVSLQSTSCTRADPSCLGFAGYADSGDSLAQLQVLVALRGSITRLPAGAITVGGNFLAVPGGATLNVNNSDLSSNGVTIHAGLSIASGNVNSVGLPGAPPASTRIVDPALLPVMQPGFTTADRQFAAFFGMTPDTYRHQPSVVQLDCSAGCASATLQLAMLRNPGRALWLRGATELLPAGLLTLDASLGTAAAPALIITDGGDVTISTGVNFTGLLYSRNSPTFTLSLAGSTTTLQGALIAEGDLSTAGSYSAATVNYDASVLTQLRVAYGSFVRVPGGWKDF